MAAAPTPTPAPHFDPSRDPEADLRVAIAQAQRQGKNILLDVGGEWCSWCHLLDATLVKEASLALLFQRHYVVVRVNYSDENENKPFLSRFPKHLGYPHIYVLDRNGRLLHSQHTSLLESGKGYSIKALEEFLRAWAPSRVPGV
jgi:thiol:disulfide interchange protein